MKQDNIERITEIKEELKKLPNGYISTKVIGGNVYYYHQWSENGKKYSKFLSELELKKLSELIKKRQSLEVELKSLKKGFISDDILKCTLMHKNTKIVDLFIDINSGNIKSFGMSYSLNHLPIGTSNKYESINETNFYEWWNERSIPLSRSGIQEAMEKLNITSPKSLIIKCHGLSLSDQYWIKPTDSDIEWEDINFFDNDFADDVGEILLGNDRKNKELDLSSPDNTSVGNLKKKWKISSEKRIMVKGGSNPFRQEPFNEVVASRVAKALGINCIDYSLFYDKGFPYCECEDFISKNEDLITAYQITKVLKKQNDDSSYTHFVKCCQKLGIKNAEEYLDKMIVLDFIIANEDRHFNNFGAIRDANTLEFKGFSPIYDSGSSFGFDKITADIFPTNNIIAKPFKKNPLEQLKLVKSFNWLDCEKLDNAKKIIKECFESYESKYLDKERIKAIVDSACKRIEIIKQNI